MRTKPTKYNKKVVDKICALIRKDTYSIAEICATVRISESTFYHWQANVVEFGEAIAQARAAFDEMIVNEAKNSLRKKVSGYTIQETHTTYQNSVDPEGKSKPKIKEQKIIDKHFQPDTEAIKFVLTNKAPDEYQNKTTAELSGKNGKDLFANVSDEDLDKRIEENLNKLEISRSKDKKVN